MVLAFMGCRCLVMFVVFVFAVLGCLLWWVLVVLFLVVGLLLSVSGLVMVYGWL